MTKEKKEAIDLVCKDCGNNFYFSVKEQKFYAEQGFQQPKRCFNCRRAKKAKNQSHENVENMPESDAEMLGEHEESPE